MVNPDPKEIFEQLEIFPKEFITNFTESWGQLLRVFSDEGEMGEVRKSSDWQLVPKNFGAIRIVVFRDESGIVLRWATDSFLSMWSQHPSHDRLIGYRDDDVSNVRSGYCYPQEDGTFKIK